MCCVSGTFEASSRRRSVRPYQGAGGEAEADNGQRTAASTGKSDDDDDGGATNSELFILWTRDEFRPVSALINKNMLISLNAKKGGPFILDQTPSFLYI